MALGLPESNSIQVGNQAVAQIAIGELISSSLALGLVLSRLFRLENLFNYSATKLVAENTVQSFNKQALSTLMRGIGVGVTGLFTTGSAFSGSISQRLTEKSLAGDRTEIKTMGEYRDVAQETVDKVQTDKVAGVEKDPSKVSESELSTAEQKKRMKNLTERQDYSDLKLRDENAKMTDEQVIRASGEDAEALRDHLDKLISKKEDALAAKREAAYRKGDKIGSGIQGIGMVFDGILQSIGAHFYQEAGEKEKNKAVSQSTQAMAQSSQSDLNGQVGDAIRTAIQTSEINVSIAQGDNLSNS